MEAGRWAGAWARRMYPGLVVLRGKLVADPFCPLIFQERSSYNANNVQTFNRTDAEKSFHNRATLFPKDF